MVFTIITYYKPVIRHLYGVYHHNLLQSCWKAPQWCLPSQPITILFRRHLYGVYYHHTYYKPVRRHLYGVYHHNLLEGTSMVFTIITYCKPVRRHLYGVYHHNLLQSC